MVSTGSNFDLVTGTHFGSPAGCRGGSTYDWVTPLEPIVSEGYISQLPLPSGSDCYSFDKSKYNSAAFPGSVFACGEGTDEHRIGHYYYVLIFDTERQQNNFPTLCNATTGICNTHTYCILGPRR